MEVLKIFTGFQFVSRYNANMLALTSILGTRVPEGLPACPYRNLPMVSSEAPFQENLAFRSQGGEARAFSVVTVHLCYVLGNVNPFLFSRTFDFNTLFFSAYSNSCMSSTR